MRWAHQPTIQLHQRQRNPGAGCPVRATPPAPSRVSGGVNSIETGGRSTPYPSEAAALAAHGGVLPAGTEVSWPERNTECFKSERFRRELVRHQPRPVVTGASRSAENRSTQMPPNQYQVNFVLGGRPASGGSRAERRPAGWRLFSTRNLAPVSTARVDGSGLEISRDDPRLGLVCACGSFACHDQISGRTNRRALVDGLHPPWRSASVLSLVVVMV